MDKNYKDYIGTVIRGCKILSSERQTIRNRIYTKYLVLCKCGKEFNISGIALFNKVYRNEDSNCGCIKRKSNDGKKVIPLESHLNKIIRGVKVLKLIRHDEKGIQYRIPKFECLCICGDIFLTQSAHLLKEKYQNSQANCGCTKNTPREHKRDYNYTTYRRYMGSVKRSAKKRGLEFNLTLEQFIQIVKKPCYYCNKVSLKNAFKSLEDSIFSKKHTKGKNKLNIVNSKWEDSDKYTVECSGIDRSNNKEGYTLKNSLPCCTRCNIIKHSLNTDDFYNHIEKILEVKKQREYNSSNNPYKGIKK